MLGNNKIKNTKSFRTQGVTNILESIVRQFLPPSNLNFLDELVNYHEIRDRLCTRSWIWVPTHLHDPLGVRDAVRL